eukprot:Nk52_evm16s235 gene=Nk52_evmTU16s235
MSSGGGAGGIDCPAKKGRKEGKIRKEKARGYEEMRKGQGLGLSKQSRKTETSGQKRCVFSVFHPTKQRTKYCKLLAAEGGDGLSCEKDLEAVCEKVRKAAERLAIRDGDGARKRWLSEEAWPCMGQVHASMLQTLGQGRRSKQLQQHGSIVQHMDELGLLAGGGEAAKEGVYVEMGAGTGHLSRFIHAACVSRDAISHHVLVDRMDFRGSNKADRLIRGQEKKRVRKEEGGEGSVERIQGDVGEVELVRLLAQKKGKAPIVAAVVGKHLCGPATDSSLQAVAGLRGAKQQCGVVIATCCHHLCDWETYCNRTFVTEVLDMNKEEFNLMCAMTSWASMSLKDPITACTERAARKIMGWCAKRLLDIGRGYFITNTSTQQETQPCDIFVHGICSSPKSSTSPWWILSRYTTESVEDTLLCANIHE